MARKKKVTNEFESIELNVVTDANTNGAVLPNTFTISPNFDVKEVTKDDKSKDKFIYAYTESGISRNKRDWNPTVIRSIGQQVLSKLPNGYLGHIEPSKVGTIFPEPQVTWFGVAEENLADGAIRLWLKGYVIPTAEKLKTWIKAKAVNSISVWGKIQYTETNGVKDIVSIDLKSIDISRKLGEGLPAFIVGLAGEMSEVTEDAAEMDGSFEDLRDAIQKQMRKFRDEQRKMNPGISVPWYYVRKLFPGFIIVKDDENSDLLKIPYEIKGSDVALLFDKATKVETRYVEVDKKGNETEITAMANPTYEGEMAKGKGKKKCSHDHSKLKPGQKCKECGFVAKKEEEEEATEMDLSKLTIADIKEHNPKLIEAIAAEMANQEKNKATQAMAGEMSSITDTLKVSKAEEVIAMANALPTFLGEMASALELEQFGGEQEGETTPTKEDVIAGVKQVVADNKTLKEDAKEVSAILQVGEGETSKDKVKAMVEEQRINFNKTQVKTVADKFAELTKDVKDAIVLDYLKDDFSKFLSAKPEEITNQEWAKKAVKDIEKALPEKLKKHTERIAKATKAGSVAGEMAHIGNLGNGLGVTGAGAVGGSEDEKSYDEMTPEEIATKLGY